MKSMILAVAAVLAITSMAACEDQTTTVGKGQLAITLPAPGSSTVTAFLIEVYEGSCLTSAPVDPENSVCVALEPGDLPLGLPSPAPQAGDHKFADRYFNLLVGDYCVRATPKTACGGAGLTVTGCTAPTGTATVTAGLTKEIVLVSDCDRTDTGGLDTVVVLNNDPLIQSLTFSPSKFVCAGSAVTITATALDPDLDPLNWTWTSVPGGCSATGSSSSAVTEQSSMTCSPTADQTVTVKACDTGTPPLCAELTFPLHVYDCPPAPTCPTGTDCHGNAVTTGTICGLNYHIYNCVGPETGQGWWVDTKVACTCTPPYYCPTGTDCHGNAVTTGSVCGTNLHVWNCTNTGGWQDSAQDCTCQ